jgi:hypothetical protein
MSKKRKDLEFRACQRCGRCVILDKFTLCYECRRLEKLSVDQALSYLEDHRGATLGEVAEATGVDASLVLKLIRGGRMETVAKNKLKNKFHLMKSS